MSNAKWFVDPDGEYWRDLKTQGGVQAQGEDGRWGVPLALSTAKEQYGLAPVSDELGMVLSAFDEFRIESNQQRQFRALRLSVITIVEAMSNFTGADVAAEKKMIRSASDPSKPLTVDYDEMERE
jgi:hypothetical protein